MELDREEEVWSISVFIALLSLIFTQTGFNGFIDLMEFGGFMVTFGALMLTAIILEERIRD
jgi:hypothetical protein